MDGRRDSTASITIRRRRIAREGCVIIISKRDNPAIRHSGSRTDTARGIFKALKALKREATESAMEDKIDCKTAEQTRDLAVKPKGSGKKKLHTYMIKRIKFGKRNLRPEIGGRGDSQTAEEANDLAVPPKVLSFEERRIRYGKSLMRKRKNGWIWKYNPGLEPSFNVKWFGEDEDMDVDEVKDESGDEEDEEDEEDEGYEEDEEYSLVRCRPRYQQFDESGKREYFLYLAEDGPFDRVYYNNLFQKVLKCSEDDAFDRLVKESGSPNTRILLLDLTEAEADDFAGLPEICCVKPNFGSW